MVIESNNYNRNFGFQSDTSLYGNNNPMNQSLDNIFPNQQVAYNLSQKSPMNLNFPNSAHQIPTIGGSSLNPPVQNFYADPYLLASSISPPGTHHSSYMKNNGLVPASNEVGMYKEHSGLFPSNASQQLKRPMEVQGHATNSLFNIPNFGSSASANPCIGADRRAVAYPKAKKKNERNNGNAIKGHWMQDEDRMLLSLVDKYGSKKWSYIARMMPGRLGKQLRERYNNHLKPGLKKDAWTEEEDMKLIQAHENMGNKWAEISKLLPGRSESDIKNRWNATKRKCMNAISKSSSTPKPSSLFENYVKNMFNKVGQSSSPESAQSTVMGGSSSGGSNNQQAVTDGSGGGGGGGGGDGLMDYGLQSSFDPNVMANNNGPSSQYESMSYLDMLFE